MTLTVQEIEQIALLARLTLTDREKRRYAEQLSVVFSYMDRLQEVDTDGVQETCQVTGLEDVLRMDVTQATDDDIKRKLLAQFPMKVGNLLAVKAVFDNRE